MKSYRLLIHGFILIMLSLLLWGCLEFSITTQVMPDGGIIRTVMVKGDSSDIFTGSYRVPADDSWTITTRYEPRNQKDSNDSEIYVYEATKEFKDFRALNQEFSGDSLIINRSSIKVNLEKKFYGFFNRLRYTETYSKLFPFRSVPVGDYLNDTELKIHLADEKDIYYSPENDKIMIVIDSADIRVLSQNDSIRFRELRDTIEQKFESWQKVNIYNDFYQLVIATLNKLGKTTDAVANKEPFYLWLDSARVVETGIENDEAFIDAAAAYFNVDPENLINADQEGFETFNTKFRVAAFTLESYTNIVMMPGKIYKSNAEAGSDNIVSWTYKIDDFYATDYTMTVESRFVNKWFTAVAGILFLLVILFVFWGRRK